MLIKIDFVFKNQSSLRDRNSILFEAQIQNITNSVLYMENVKLHQFKNDVLIEEIHSNKNDSSNESNNLSVLKYDKSALIKPSEVKQYMFKVQYPDIELEKKPLMVGKLDISWRYSMGECGHLQTHPLEQPVL